MYEPYWQRFGRVPGLLVHKSIGLRGYTTATTPTSYLLDVLVPNPTLAPRIQPDRPQVQMQQQHRSQHENCRESHPSRSPGAEPSSPKRPVKTSSSRRDTAAEAITCNLQTVHPTHKKQNKRSNGKTRIEGARLGFPELRPKTFQSDKKLQIITKMRIITTIIILYHIEI